jgi:hypothetical protein
LDRSRDRYSPADIECSISTSFLCFFTVLFKFRRLEQNKKINKEKRKEIVSVKEKEGLSWHDISTYQHINLTKICEIGRGKYRSSNSSLETELSNYSSHNPVEESSSFFPKWNDHIFIKLLL